MESGTVAAMLIAEAHAKNPHEWEAAVEDIWDNAINELKTNNGFKGLIAMWNNDNSNQVSVIGLWDTMEHRLAYESRSADYVRGLFNNLFRRVPDRPRYIVTKAELV